MCFPSKWLKNNFSEEDKPKPSGPESTTTAKKPASKPAVEPTTSNADIPTKKDPKTFKTAIVIYTMYGHIASRESQRSICDLPVPNWTDYVANYGVFYATRRKSE
jgi:hypothetical protein